MFKERTHKRYYPPRGKPQAFPHRRPHPPGMFRPLMPMSKESFMEMRKYFVLKILMDNPEGITGYQLQEEYHFPRTNVLRSLDQLTSEKMVDTREEIVDGRTNKLYIINEKGTKELEILKEKWGERFNMMSDTTMPFFTRGERSFVMRRINELENSEDAVDYFRGLRSKIKSRINSLESRLNDMNDIRKELDTIIDMVENDKEFDRKKIVDHIKNWFESKKNEKQSNNN